MEPSGRKYQRRNYFIKKEFQFEFILKFCLILLAGIILSTCLVFIFSQDTLTSSFNDARLVIENTGQAILPVILITNLVTLALITLAAIVVTLFISHRIAGPMFRFEKDLKQVAKGDLNLRVHLRKKDQFSEMARSFNEMVASLHVKVLRIHHETDSMLKLDVSKKTVDMYDQKLEQLKQAIEKDFSL